MLKQKILSGQRAYGTMIRMIRNPAICYIAKNSNLDFVMYDCEHSDYSMESLRDLFLMGNALGLPGMLRVPNLAKQYVSRALDQGATGVMSPMIETEEMAAELVKYSKYQPVGNRGYSAGIAHTDYQVPGKHTEIMENCNAKVISIAQIETRQAVDNAEEIAATPGIDVLLIGPNDLSLSLGIPGDLFHSVELEAIKHVAAACKKHGKAFGIHSGEKLLKMFYEDLNVLMLQSDIEVLTKGFSDIRPALEK